MDTIVQSRLVEGATKGRAAALVHAPEVRIVPLDGLRAVGFFGVLLMHLHWQVPNGGVGVNMFFTLSGFVITSLLLREHARQGTIRLARFFARRAARLMPALLVVIAVFTVYAALLPDAHQLQRETQAGALPALFSFANWLRVSGDNLGFLSHTWSLSVEEQFYLVWPLVLLAAHAVAGRRGVLIAALAGSCVSLGVRLTLWDGLTALPRISNGSDTTADQLLIGCALAVLVVEAPELVRRVARRVAWPAGAAILAVMVTDVDQTWLYTFGYTLLALGIAAVIAHVVTEPRALMARGLAWQPLVGIGRMTYGLYLWHFPIVKAAGGHVSSRVALTVVTMIATAIATGVSYRFIEMPVIRWARRRSRAADAQTSTDRAGQVRRPPVGVAGATGAPGP